MSRLLVLLLGILLAPGRGAIAAEPDTMCETHDVLEAVCTRCNPRLIPIFKAKKDWCAEHDFPESFCPACHPSRGGRPAADVGAGKAPADGLRIKLEAAEIVPLAGIEVRKVTEEPDQPVVLAWARLSYDPTRVALLNPRSAGVVRSLHAEVGDRVEAGASLASIESATVGIDRSRLEAATTRRRIARSNLERQRQLERSGVGIRRDLLASEQEVASAQAEVETAQASLNVVGRTEGDGRSQLQTPIRGTVTRRAVSLGQMVDSEHILFEVVDTSVLLAEIQIPETDIARVHAGQQVEIVFPAWPDRPRAGTITSLTPAVDPLSRTITARALLPNADGTLRANMFGEARILVGSARRSFLVPRHSLQQVEDVWLAFVRVAPDEFETRRVRLGALDREKAHVLEGLEAGEDVVTTGSFLLKTETLKDSIGAGCCAVEER